MSFSLKVSNCTHFTTLSSYFLTSQLNFLFTATPFFESKTTPSFKLYTLGTNINPKFCRFLSSKVAFKILDQIQLLYFHLFLFFLILSHLLQVNYQNLGMDINLMFLKLHSINLTVCFEFFVFFPQLFIKPCFSFYSILILTYF